MGGCTRRKEASDGDPLESDRLEQEVFEFLRKGEEAVIDAGRKWAKAVGELAPLEVPAVRELVKGIFDFTEEALKTQREFAHRMLVEARGAVMAAVPMSKHTPRPASSAPKTARAHRAPATRTRRTTAA